MIYVLLFSAMFSGLALIASHFNNAIAVLYFSISACVTLLIGATGKVQA